MNLKVKTICFHITERSKLLRAAFADIAGQRTHAENVTTFI